jgi:cyclin B
MRLVLVNWMQLVHANQQFHIETLFLAVRLVDIYLSRKAIDSAQLQVLGIAALCLASKTEETESARANLLNGYTGGPFTYEQLTAMEVDLFTTVDFVITRPTICDFLMRYSDLLALNGTVFFMAHYIAEFVLLVPETIGIEPSVLAAAIVCLARAVSQEQPIWPESIEKYASVQLPEIQGLCRTILAGIQQLDQCDQLAVRAKFASEELGAVATMGALAVPENVWLA